MEHPKIIFFSCRRCILPRFYQKMDSLVFDGKGQVNILHLGGSHIQADVFSNRVRVKTVKFYPGFAASRGFVFPFSVAKPIHPRATPQVIKSMGHEQERAQKYYQTARTLGIAASTEDSAAEVTILLNNITVRLSGFIVMSAFSVILRMVPLSRF
jgi:hypothetical protein